MKLIELNIGLSTPQGGQLNPIEVLNALNARGFDLITYRLHDSICKDGVEKCLAVKLTPPADWQEQIRLLANKLGQECIAVVGFIGHAPYDTFCADLWKSPEVEETPEEFNGFTRQEFLNYLEFSIIPDSRESGFDGYADDLETALHFLKK